MFGCCFSSKAKAQRRQNVTKIAPSTPTPKPPENNDNSLRNDKAIQHHLAGEESKTFDENLPQVVYGQVDQPAPVEDNRNQNGNMGIHVGQFESSAEGTSTPRQALASSAVQRVETESDGPPQQMFGFSNNHQQVKHRAHSMVVPGVGRSAGGDYGGEGGTFGAQKTLHQIKRMTSIKSPYFEQPKKSLGLQRNTSEEAMRRMATTKEQLSQIMQHKESITLVGDCISFADDQSTSAKIVKAEKFSRKNRFQCTFCLGKVCTKERWEKCAEPLIQGLHSNMIEDKLIGSQRPQTSKILKFQIIDQMLQLNIGVVVNLQEPGEHALCGEGIDDQIGFSYDPMVFQARGIATFNWFWEDLTCPNNELVLVIMQNISRFDQMGKRIFVHCHAGTGRTGLVIACYLVYSGMANSGTEAVSKVRTQRPGSLSKKSQRQFVIDFSAWLEMKRKSFFPPADSSTGGGKVLSYSQLMQDNLALVHGKDIQDFRYFPKFLGTCLNQLLKETSSQETEQLTIEKFLSYHKSILASSTQEAQSQVSATLGEIQADIWRDKWESLERVTDKSLLAKAILTFLTLFQRDAHDKKESSSSSADKKREYTYYLGLAYFFARILLFFEQSVEPETIPSETRQSFLLAMAKLIPYSKHVAAHFNIKAKDALVNLSVNQIVLFRQQIQSSGQTPSMFAIIQGELQATFTSQSAYKSPQAVALASIVRHVTQTRGHHKKNQLTAETQVPAQNTLMMSAYMNSDVDKKRISAISIDDDAADGEKQKQEMGCHPATVTTLTKDSVSDQQQHKQPEQAEAQSSLFGDQLQQQQMHIQSNELINGPADTATAQEDK